MKVTIVDNRKIKECAEILAETEIDVRMNALDLLLITTALGKFSAEERRVHLEGLCSGISAGSYGTHPMAMLTTVQRSSILKNYAKLDWSALNGITKNVLRQLGMEEN